MKKLVLILVSIFIQVSLFAQVAGNQVYNKNTYQNNYRPNLPTKGSHQFQSNALKITVNLMMEKEASLYRMTVGVSQEETSIKVCDERINARIRGLLNNLSQLNLQDSAIYIDFISQTKVYDYKANQQQSIQFEAGVEIKKNVIIQFDDLKLVDKIVSACAQAEVYDIIKLDYLDIDREIAFAELYEEALKLCRQRKGVLVKNSMEKATGRFKVAQSNFYANYPKNLYKEYQAFESSQLNVYQKQDKKNYIKKEARKHRTFYYDGLDLNLFDKIIPANNPDVGIQYVLSVTVLFELEKPF